MSLKVTAICATKGRHRCAERTLGFFLAQGYENKVLLIYNNHEIPQQLSADVPSNVILVNNHIDSTTGTPYKDLGSIYRDALQHVPADTDIICFMDDDDAYMPYHLEDGVRGYVKHTDCCHIKAYRADKFFHRYKTEWFRDKGMYAEPTIFVNAQWVREHGFQLVAGAQHHGWLDPLLTDSKMYFDYETRETLIIDWSQEIPTWKTSGAVDDPNNWNNYIMHSQEHGDQILTPTDPTAYYNQVILHFPMLNTWSPLPFFTTKPSTITNTSTMHAEVDQLIQQVKSQFPTYFDSKRVLEVGSLNINGSIRKHFSNCSYLGIDIGEGPGVDLVTPIHEFPKTAPKFDVVVSTEMLEHDVYWKDSLKAMYDALKPEGLLIITCAGPNRHEHGTKRTTPGDSPYTTDYYKNISSNEIQQELPADLFMQHGAQHVRDDNDTWFWGVKADGKIAVQPITKYGDLQFITAQPDERIFAAEVETQIVQLREWGLEDRMNVLVYWWPTADKQSINPDWICLRMRYPQVKFRFYKEDPRHGVAQYRQIYSSIIRPYCLQKYWEERPELANIPMFYMDSDVIFEKRPDIEAMEMGNTCFVTNTVGYLGVDYMRKKATEEGVGLQPDHFIDIAAEVVGIKKDMILSQDNDCGGAQYVLKGVTAAFWEKMGKDTMTIKNSFAFQNQQYFQERGRVRGKSAEHAGIQSWCADMWSLLYNMYYFGLPVKAPDFMKSIWTENEIARLQTDFKGAVIIHNAGGVDPRFFNKRDYRNTESGVGRYYGRWPWEENFGYVDPTYCSYLYVQALIKAGIARKEQGLPI